MTISDLDPALMERLRTRAAEHGRPVEAEVRHLLEAALNVAPGLSGRDLCASIQARFAPLGGADLELPSRSPGRELPAFR